MGKQILPHCNWATILILGLLIVAACDSYYRPKDDSHQEQYWQGFYKWHTVIIIITLILSVCFSIQFYNTFQGKLAAPDLTAECSGSIFGKLCKDKLYRYLYDAFWSLVANRRYVYGILSMALVGNALVNTYYVSRATSDREVLAIQTIQQTWFGTQDGLVFRLIHYWWFFILIIVLEGSGTLSSAAAKGVSAARIAKHALQSSTLSF